MSPTTSLFVAIVLANLISGLALVHLVSWLVKSEFSRLAAKLEEKALTLFEEYREDVWERPMSEDASTKTYPAPYADGCDEGCGCEEEELGEEEGIYDALDVEWNLQQRKFDNKDAYAGLPDFRPIDGWASPYWMDSHGYLLKLVEEGAHVNTIEFRAAEVGEPEICVMTATRFKAFRNIPALFLSDNESEYVQLVRGAGFAA